MNRVIDELLATGDTLPSALDLDVAALTAPAVPALAVVGEERLSAFDVEDEEAHERAHARRRRVLGLVMLACGSVMAVAGSIALGF